MLTCMDAQTAIAMAGIAGTLLAALGGIYMGHQLEHQAESRREDAALRRAVPPRAHGA